MECSDPLSSEFDVGESILQLVRRTSVYFVHPIALVTSRTVICIPFRQSWLLRALRMLYCPQSTVYLIKLWPPDATKI